MARGEACGRSSGFTYVVALIAVALIGLGLSAGAGMWQTASQREKERELLFAGDQIRTAIGAYYAATPGGVRQYPRTLEQLLRDERYPVTVRHLRRIYLDPMTGRADWDLIRRPDGSLVGVASRSTARPFKTDNFQNPLDRSFRSSKTLADWKFIHVETTTAPPATKSGIPEGAESLFKPVAPVLPESVVTPVTPPPVASDAPVPISD